MLPTASTGYKEQMGILRSAALLAIGKKVYDEARKPHNRRKLREMMERVKARRGGGSAPSR